MSTEAPAFPPLPEPTQFELYSSTQMHAYAALHAADLQRQLEEARKDAQELFHLMAFAHSYVDPKDKEYWTLAGCTKVLKRLDAAMEQPT